MKKSIFVLLLFTINLTFGVSQTLQDFPLTSAPDTTLTQVIEIDKKFLAFDAKYDEQGELRLIRPNIKKTRKEYIAKLREELEFVKTDINGLRDMLQKQIANRERITALIHREREDKKK